MTAPPQAKTYEVNDGISPVQFDGYLLSEISNESPHRDRWTEVKLYRTTTGRYVLNVVARSVIFHSVNGCGTVTGEQMKYSNAVDQDGTACTRCGTTIRSAVRPDPLVVMEGDRHQTRVFLDLKKLNEGVNEFGGLGRQAIEQAVREGHITATELSTIRTVIL